MVAGSASDRPGSGTRAAGHRRDGAAAARAASAADGSTPNPPSTATDVTPTDVNAAAIRP